SGAIRSRWQNRSVTDSTISVVSSSSIPMPPFVTPPRPGPVCVGRRGLPHLRQLPPEMRAQPQHRVGAVDTGFLWAPQATPTSPSAQPVPSWRALPPCWPPPFPERLAQVGDSLFAVVMLFYLVFARRLAVATNHITAAKQYFHVVRQTEVRPLSTDPS